MPYIRIYNNKESKDLKDNECNEDSGGRLAIMQPYLFPYIGYFQLMSASNQWICFDDTQFTNKGWINRNRILHPDKDKEWQYLSIPLAGKSSFDKICDIEVSLLHKWRENFIGKLSIYKRIAPYYDETISFVKDCLSIQDSNLSDLVCKILKKTAAYLEIKTEISIQSKMRMNLGNKIEHPGQWALEISSYMQAKVYINPIGGQYLFKPLEFEDKNIVLLFLKPDLQEYSQRREKFIKDLSIIDVLMWCGREKTKGFLNLYKLHSPNEL